MLNTIRAFAKAVPFEHGSIAENRTEIRAEAEHRNDVRGTAPVPPSGQCGTLRGRGRTGIGDRLRGREPEPRPDLDAAAAVVGAVHVESVATVRVEIAQNVATAAPDHMDARTRTRGTHHEHAIVTTTGVHAQVRCLLRAEVP